MAKWQPPIPTGALWSPEAVTLGPALALLGYAYDLVQGDGTFKINLHEVTDAMGVPYPTLKRWWTQLRAGPFFVEVTDQGRRGMLVRFAEEWLDRRILDRREPKSRSDMISNPETPTDDTGSEMISNPIEAPQSVDNRAVIGTETGSLLNGLYIGTHGVQEDHHSDGAPAVPPPAPKKKRALRSVEKTQTELLNTPLAIYRRITNMRSPNQAQRELIETVTDLDVWESTCELWALNGYDARKVPNLIDRYHKTLKEKQRQAAASAAYQNGTHAAEPFDYDSLPNPNDERERRAAAGRAARQAALAARKAGTP